MGLTILPFFMIFSTSLLFYNKKESLNSRAIKHKYYLYPLSLVTIIPMSIFFTRELYLEYVFYISYSSSVLIVASLLMIYLLIGVRVASFSNKATKKCESARPLKFIGLSFLVSAIVSLAIEPSFKVICGLGNFHSGEEAREISVAKLERTCFTPVLDAKLIAEKNLIWSATHQLCWDKLVDYMKGPIKSSPAIAVVEKLNQERFDPKWIDDSSYIALTSMRKIDFSKSLGKKFNKKSGSALLKQMPKEGPSRVFFYSYLECRLPFEWKFQRSEYAMVFSDGGRVESFGLRGYNPASEKEQNCIKQIEIKYCEGDEAVIELKTTKNNHRLILAKVAPKETLIETVQYVDSLIKEGAGYKYRFEHNAVISIPVIDFDLVKVYGELSGLRIGPDEKIEESVQKIRFKLDESGAYVLSEAYLSMSLGGGPVNNLIFNKPFLVMLRYKDGERPYFVAWIGNSELLKKTTKQTMREYYEAER